MWEILLKIFQVDVNIAGATLAKVNKSVLLPTYIFITSHFLTVGYYSFGSLSHPKDGIYS
jgi:hypothetical protein